jgi:hypothetical protein
VVKGWMCDICKEVYNTEREANQCERIHHVEKNLNELSKIVQEDVDLIGSLIKKLNDLTNKVNNK